MRKVSILLALVCFTTSSFGQDSLPVDGQNGYTLVANRFIGNLNFFRNWVEYQGGFQDSTGEFFFGLKYIYMMTSSQRYELYIYLQDFEGEHRYAQYDDFQIGSEQQKYALLKIGNYSGNAGNSLFYNLGMKFTTYDQDNDQSRDNCAMHQMGGWWYRDCSYCNLFGLFLNGNHSVALDRKGMYWRGWRGEHYSYRTMKMYIKQWNYKTI